MAVGREAVGRREEGKVFLHRCPDPRPFIMVMSRSMNMSMGMGMGIWSMNKNMSMNTDTDTDKSMNTDTDTDKSMSMDTDMDKSMSMDTEMNKVCKAGILTLFRGFHQRRSVLLLLHNSLFILVYFVTAILVLLVWVMDGGTLHVSAHGG